MNIAEHKLNIFREIDQLPEESLIEVEKLIAKLKSEQQITKKDISAVFGLLKATKGVSLEQMEESIAKGACGD